MEKTLLIQFLALSLYTGFLGYCFCDGFKLSHLKKLICFASLLLMAAYALYAKGQLDLALILPVPTLLALLFCVRERRKKNPSPE